jgi:hypothetical protein
MVNRITITLPTPLAEAIAKLAAEHMRPPKQQIIWMLCEAVRIATIPETSEKHTGAAQNEDCRTEEPVHAGAR